MQKRERVEIAWILFFWVSDLLEKETLTEQYSVDPQLEKTAQMSVMQWYW